MAARSSAPPKLHLTFADQSFFVGGAIVNQAASSARQGSDGRSFTTSGQGSDQRPAGRASADNRGGTVERALPNDHVTPAPPRCRVITTLCDDARRHRRPF